MKKHKKIHLENWYTCLNCDNQFQLYDALVNHKNSIRTKCPYCSSKEFILSKYKKENSIEDAFDYNNYDYSNYDKYDDYY